MRQEWGDRELRELFARLKLADRPPQGRSAGALALARRRLAPGRAAAGPIRLAWPAGLAAAAALTVLAVFVYVGHSGRQSAAPDAIEIARDVSSWNAPTDSLLELGELVLPRGVPSLELTSVAVSDPSTASPLE